MYNGQPTNIPVSSSSTLKARARKIQPIIQSDTGSFEQVFRELKSLLARAEYRNYLSSAEKILLEEKWTKMLLMLLGIGNLRVMKSVRYRLREQTAEEEEPYGGPDD